MEFTVKATENKAVRNIVVGGAVVGTITRSTIEVERPIPGTTLRYAKGRMETRFHVRLSRAAFVGAPMSITSDRLGSYTLKAAKAEVAARLATLTLR
ncbi:hypothetical protein [Micromonospora sp. WMMC273]|uniref:hypothetical protein n=1 Tax=Micromonospora sp. WMMC273 TaxID=3015157 RepID=UPI0022B5F93C|nr:hypothetical protein [Micromonospora sp. WMMC273]MCZ7478894.1 hypothetical protein [Micromonospora sp. WMMC273]